VAGLLGDVENVVVVVVAGPRALVGVLADAHLDRLFEVVFGLEDVAGAEERFGGAPARHAQFHGSYSQGVGGKDSFAVGSHLGRRAEPDESAARPRVPAYRTPGKTLSF